MRGLIFLISLFLFPVVLGVLGPAVVVQQANLSFEKAVVDQAYPGEHFTPEVYLTNTGDGDVIVLESRLEWASSSKTYVSTAYPMLVPPGYTAKFSFIIQKPGCPDFSTNQSFKFNITYTETADSNTSYLSGDYWYNVSNPLSIESLSIDTNEVFPLSIIGLDRFSFVLRNDGKERIDYSMSASNPGSVFPEFVTYSGVYQSSDLEDRSFSIYGKDKQVFGVLLYPISPSTALPFILNLTTNCGNTSKQISFNVEVVSEKAGFFATVPDLNPGFLLLILITSSLMYGLRFKKP